MVCLGSEDSGGGDAKLPPPPTKKQRVSEAFPSLARDEAWLPLLTRLCRMGRWVHPDHYTRCQSVINGLADEIRAAAAASAGTRLMMMMAWSCLCGGSRMLVFGLIGQLEGPGGEVLTMREEQVFDALLELLLR